MPWGHHKLILDKVKGDVGKALFFVAQTLENGWSRAMLLNWIDSGLFERSGKALTNFKETLPQPSSDLAQELTKDPYNFAFAEVTRRHNEAQRSTTERCPIREYHKVLDRTWYWLCLRRQGVSFGDW